MKRMVDENELEEQINGVSNEIKTVGRIVNTLTSRDYYLSLNQVTLKPVGGSNILTMKLFCLSNNSAKLTESNYKSHINTGYSWFNGVFINSNNQICIPEKFVSATTGYDVTFRNLTTGLEETINLTFGSSFMQKISANY